MGRTPDRTRAALAGPLALLAMAAIVVAAPLLLLVLAGDPLPDHLPTLDEVAQRLTTPDRGEVLLWTLSAAGWIAWAVLAATLLLELVAQLTGWSTPRLPGLAGPQRLATLLVAAALATASAPGISHANAAYLQPAAAEQQPEQPRGGRIAAAPVEPAAPAQLVHTVSRGEAMLDIAERYGVSVARLAAANHHRRQPDGGALRPGQLRIYPGWQLAIPAAGAPLATGGPTASAGGPAASAGGPAAPAADGPPAPAGHGGEQPSQRIVHEVATGDWMWHIAGRYLGDEQRYPEIAALNPHLAERYADYPDHIQPGDRLLLPPDATDSGPRPHATGPALAPESAQPEPAQPEPAPPEPAPSTAPPAATPAPAPSPPAPAEPSAPATASSAPATAPSAPAAAPQPEPARPAEPAAGPDTPPDRPVSTLGSLVAAGALASVLLGAVTAYRRAARARRRYGHRSGAAGASPTESGVRSAATGDLARLDQALRVLAAALAPTAAPASGSGPAPPLPDIGAVWVAEGEIHLVLASPTSLRPPPPFRAADSGTWVLPAGAPLPEAAGTLAPLPALVTVGSGDGTHLLVDLERLGMLTVSGRPDGCGDLLRHIAAELAHNPWSDQAEVTLVGFPPEQAQLLAGLNPRRIRVGESVPAAVDQLRRRHGRNRDALQRHHVPDAMHGRVTDTAADAWTPQLLLVYAAADPYEQRLLAALGAELAGAGRRCAVAVAAPELPGHPDHAAGGRVTVTDGGLLSVDFLAGDAQLPAACLPEHLLAPLAELLRQAADTSDHPIPPAAEPWAADADAAGAPLAGGPSAGSASAGGPSAGGPSGVGPPAGGASAVSPEAAAVLRADTPAVPLPTVTPTGPRDSTLDDDVHGWFHDRLPRLEVLGPVRVRAAGPPPSRRQRACQELVVLLAACGAAGADAGEIAALLWPHQPPPATARTEVIATTRRWLGDAADGTPWLTEADADGRYRLQPGLLVDWHLLRRLRTRGRRTGSAADLRAALQLVRGAPLDGAGDPTGAPGRASYAWLPGSGYDPDLLLAGVVDTAHDLVTQCLAEGQPGTARWAVQQAWLADPYRSDDLPWRDLLRIAHTEGGAGQVRAVVAELLHWRDADHVDELAPETRSQIAQLLGAGAGVS